MRKTLIYQGFWLARGSPGPRKSLCTKDFGPWLKTLAAQGLSDCVAAAVALMGLHDLTDLAGETVCATVIAVSPLGV